MLGYKQFFLKEKEEFEKDFQTYHLTEEMIEMFDVLCEEEDPRMQGNVWAKVRAGAKAYFSAGPEQRMQYKKNADALRTSKKIFTDETANKKLSDSAKSLSSSANAKLISSNKRVEGYKTIGVTLAPSTASGIDVCPAASKECVASCLGPNSGRGVYDNTKNARVAKTHFLFDHPAEFFAHLDHEITKEKTKAAASGKKLAVRLNVASDINYESLVPDLFHSHKDVQFYDYTKIKGRIKPGKLPENYHLTLSSTGLNHIDSNWGDSKKHLDNGGIVAMVFHTNPKRGSKPGGKLPKTVVDKESGRHYPVVDGDDHDLRFLDHDLNNIPKTTGVIAGLRIKGGSKNAERAGNFAVPITGEHVEAKKTLKLKDIK